MPLAICDPVGLLYKPIGHRNICGPATPHYDYEVGLRRF